jgi:DNA-binding NtrC family response regulator
VPDPRVRVSVEAIGQVDTLSVELEVDSGALLGRVPDPAGLAAEHGIPIARQVVAAPSVSANHALVWLTGDRLHVRDLGSRNGTWVRVPPHVTVDLPRADAQIRLAASAHGGDGDDLPEPARFRGADDYGDGVARAIREWFERHHLNVRVRIDRPEHEPSPNGAIAVRLANNAMLAIQSDGTIDERFQHLVSRISRYVAAQNALYLAEDEARRDGMILASQPIRQVHRRVVELASQGLPGMVLIGPSGTGKERLARTFHHHSGRAGALITINCSALSRDRLVADLFGAEAGAYTGAQKTMVGAVERADGGTLFLDEVGELPLEVQPQLLRFLDLGEYQRMGAIGVARTADVRIVAATNRDLRRMVAQGAFRADLFFRLALELVEVPPLDQRFPDVTAYLDTQPLGATSALDALSPDALELLRGHTWDGNFRELVNFVHRLPRHATKGSLDAAAIQPILKAGALEPRPDWSPSHETPGGWAECVRSSVAAYAASGLSDPSSWSDVVEFIEKCLKPHALMHLAGEAEATSFDEIAPSRVAERVKADRGTVIKQLRRYFDLPRRR